MKLSALLKHLRQHGCNIAREGKKHSIWINPETMEAQAVPRHTEIDNKLARKICRELSVPEIGRPTPKS